MSSGRHCSRTSGENRPGRPIDPILPSNEVSEKPGTIQSVVSSSVDTVLFALPLGLSLLRLINSETVQGTAVGFLDFSFTETQLNVLRDFAQQLLSPQAADTQTGGTGFGPITFSNGAR